jgi:hypothetical protein
LNEEIISRKKRKTLKKNIYTYIQFKTIGNNI